MEIVYADPPMMDEIDAVFNVKGKAVFFCFGDKIYNPQKKEISPAIMLHEKVHSEQQRAYGIDRWWHDYIKDVGFRFEQEIPAHRAEFRFWQGNKQQVRGFRSIEDYQLFQIARRLSGPLYGNLITFSKARQLVQ